MFIQNITLIIPNEWTQRLQYAFYYSILPPNSSISFMHLHLTDVELHIFLITFQIAHAMLRLNMHLMGMLINSS